MLLCLPYLDRLAFALHHSGYTYAESEALLELAPGAMPGLMAQARDEIRRVLDAVTVPQAVRR